MKQQSQVNPSKYSLGHEAIRRKRKAEETEDFVFNSLINSEPVKRFKNRRKVMKFRSFGDGMISAIWNKLQTLNLSRRKTQQKRIAKSSLE
jgi:hypothetical protein